TYVGYLSHPMVKHALLLEHGCEMTHNSYVRQLMLERGIDLHQFGWASVQLDGGIQNVIQKMRTWFGEQLASDREVEIVEAGLEVVRLALVTHGGMTVDVARQWAAITRWVVAAGGTVVVPGNDDLLRNE